MPSTHMNTSSTATEIDPSIDTAIDTALDMAESVCAKPPIQMRCVTGFDLFRDQEQQLLRLEAVTPFKLTVQMPLIAAKWKGLGDSERLVFKARAKECAMVPSNSRKQKRVREDAQDEKNINNKKKRKQRDPTLPKRPLSAFIFFSCDRRKTLTAEQPTLKPTECLKQMGIEWKSLTDRQHYLDLAAADKIRYGTEMGALVCK
jgi:hypothetical protein